MQSFTATVEIVPGKAKPLVQQSGKISPSLIRPLIPRKLGRGTFPPGEGLVRCLKCGAMADDIRRYIFTLHSTLHSPNFTKNNPRHPGQDPGDCALCKKAQKNRGYSPEMWKLFIDKWKKGCYNGSPYCDSMPIWGHPFQHGHFITG